MAEAITPGLQVFRYRTHEEVFAPGNPLVAVLTQTNFFTSRDYVVDLLTAKHGVSRKAAVTRASAIVPHARTALDYVDQAMSGPLDIGFLPSYYSVLNLIKVYILLSSKHADLPSNRYHGAQYKGLEKSSRSLLTDAIQLKRGGAIPLLYEVITGSKLPLNKTLEMQQIYPYIADCMAEWEMATGRQAHVAALYLTGYTGNKGHRLEARIAPRAATFSGKRDFPAIRTFKQDTTDPHLFKSSRVYPKSRTLASIAAETVDPLFVYSPHTDFTLIAVGAQRIKMFEELPIALAFFHLSSVVRYNPQYLARLRDSRHWPVIAALGRYGLFRFLTLFWSYANQKTISFHAGI